MTAPPSYSKNSPNKISNDINVYGRNTLILNNDAYQVAIANEPIDAKSNGKKSFCVRVDNAGANPHMMFGFTPMET
jgi:hypothetical protein